MSNLRCILAGADSKKGAVHIFQGGRMFCGIRRGELVFGWADIHHFATPDLHLCEECADNASYWAHGAVAIEQAEQWVDAMLKEHREALIDQKAKEFANRRDPFDVEWVHSQLLSADENGYLLNQPVGA